MTDFTTTFPYLHPSDIMVNRYAGTARCCGVHVDADEGFYLKDSQWVLCGTVTSPVELQCENNRPAREANAQAEADRQAAYAVSDEGKAEQARRAEGQAARDAGFAAQDAEWAKQGLVRCDRCGGAGHSEAWRSTGYTCFGCGGTGTKREVK
jgi:hypothetical protein